MPHRSTKLLAAALMLVSASPSSAQGGDPWTVNCEDDACTISLALIAPDSNRRAATFLAVISAEEGGSRLAAAMPLGLAIEPGIRMIAGETVIDVPFQVCFPDGCRAVRDADAAMFDALAREETLDIRYFPFGEERPVSLKMPLDGLAGALEAARSELSQP